MDAKQLLDAYAAEYKVTRGEREVHAPEAFAALRAVLDLHVPVVVADVAITYCRECEERNGAVVRYPCPTVRAITTELEGK